MIQILVEYHPQINEIITIMQNENIESKNEDSSGVTASQGEAGYEYHAMPSDVLSVREEKTTADNSLAVAVDDNEIDTDFIELIINSKIKSIPEKIADNTLTIASYVSILYFANSVRRFPIIQEKILNAFRANRYYVCTVHEAIRKALSFEAATVGTEADGFTTSFFITCVALAVIDGGIELVKYPFDRAKKKAFTDLLEKHNLKIDSSIALSSISGSQIDSLTALIEEKIAADKELLDLLLQVYFSDLKYEKLREFTAQIKEKELKSKLIDAMLVKQTAWQRFVTNTHWIEKQISIYRLGLAAVCAIPGFIYMLMEDKKIGGAPISSLFTDEADAPDQTTLMIMQVYPWMTASFPVITFHTLSLFLNLFTYVLSLNKVRTFIYNHIHAPVERWANNEARWLHRNLFWEYVALPGMVGISAYSLVQSSLLADEYAHQAGCGGLIDVLGSIYTNSKNNTVICSSATKANMISDLVADSEIDKFYLFYSSLKITFHLLMYLVEKCIDLGKRLPAEKAKLLYERFQKIDDRNLKIIAAAIFVGGGAQLFFSWRFANDIVSADLTKTMPVNMMFPANITSFNINNETMAELANQICPYADFNDVMADIIAGRNTSDPAVIIDILNKTMSELPIQLLNNSTLLVKIADACPEYGIIGLYLLSLWNDDPDCNPLVEYRAQAAFIAFLWAGVALMAASVVNISSVAEMTAIAFKSINHWLCDRPDAADIEVLDAENDKANAHAEHVLAEEKSAEVKEKVVDSNDLKESLLPAKSSTTSSGCWTSIYNFFTCNKYAKSKIANKADKNDFRDSPTDQTVMPVMTI